MKPVIRRSGTNWPLWALLILILSGCSDESSSDGGPPRLNNSVDANSPVVTEAPAETGPTVVFLGDSIAAGLHLAREDAFPSRLKAMLVEEGISFRLVNAGLSGDTTAGGAARLQWVLKQKPELLVVELGGNDALRGQPLEVIEKNLRKIVRDGKEAGVRVLLLGMRIPPNYGPEYTEGFAALYPRVAEEEGVACVPFFMEGVAGVTELNLEDGIHPTPEGHQRLAENLLEAFRQELAKASGQE